MADVSQMLNPPVLELTDDQARAATSLYMADRAGREVGDYEAEKEIFFGNRLDDKAAYQVAQKTQAGFRTEWADELMSAFDPEFEPVYENTFWQEYHDRSVEAIQYGEATARRIVTGWIDIIPSMIRGGLGTIEQVQEVAGVEGEWTVIDDILNDPFVATMLDTPMRFIEESGKISAQAQRELDAVSARHGKGSEFVSDISLAVIDTATFLQTMKIAGIKIGATPSQAMNKEVGAQMLSRLGAAGKLAAFKGLFSEAESLEERADIAAITMMYMSTPAASGVFDKASDVFIADLILNSSITAPQVSELWQRDDIDTYDKITESVKMVGADIVFSAMTKTMRSNKMSPHYKPMQEQSKKLVEKYKTAAKTKEQISELVAETNRLLELNERFSKQPKPGNIRNIVQGESDAADGAGKGFIRAEQAKSNTTEDIRLLEEKLKAIEEDDRAQEVLDVINETRDLPQDQRIDAVNKAVQDAVDGRPKTSKVKQQIERETGVKKPKKKIVVDEYQMLKKQLRDINRGIKEGKKLGAQEQRAKQKETDAKYAELHKNAYEYVKAVVHDKATVDRFRANIPKIRTIDGLDKFQKEVNDVLKRQAHKKAVGEAKSAVKELHKTKLATGLNKAANEILSKIDTKNTSDKKLEELSSIREFLESEGIEILPETAEKMSALEKVRLKDMTTSDLIELKNVAKAIVHMQKVHEKLTKQGQLEIVEEKANEFVFNQNQRNVKERPLYDRKGNRVDAKTGGLLGTKRVLDLTPDALTFYLDGAREGPIHNLFVKNIWEGDNQRLAIEREAHRYMEPFKDHIEGWDKATAKDGYKTTMGGREVLLSRSEKIAVYLDSLNKDNLRHATEGGYEIGGESYKPTQDDIDRISQSVIDNKLELDVATAIHNGYENILRPTINETSNKVNGYDIADVDHYHPINVVRGVGADAEVTPTTMREYTQQLLDSSGHFKGRRGGKNQIKLQDAINKYDQMVKLVSKYNGYAEAITLQKKFLDGVSSDGTSVRKILTENYGKRYVASLERLTKDIEAGGSAWHVIPGMETINKGIMHVGRGYLALNLGVAAGQPVSYITAGNVIPFRHWEKGNRSNKMVPWELMGEHSSLLWSRGKGHLDIAFGESAEAKRMAKKMTPIRAMDHLAISKIWTAAESWVKDDLGRIDYAEVAKRVDDVVRRTQPTFESIDRPELARNPNLRVISMFSSVINKNHALKFKNDIEALEKIKQGKWDNKSKAEWMRKSMINRIMTPTVYAAIKTAASVGFLNDIFVDDENTFVKRFLNKIADASIGEMGMISSKVGQFIHYVLSKKSDKILGHEQNMPGTRELEDIATSLISMSEFAFRADEDLSNLKTEKQRVAEREKDEEMVRRLVRGSLALGGRGYQNIYDWGELIYDTATKEEKSIFD